MYTARINPPWHSSTSASTSGDDASCLVRAAQRTLLQSGAQRIRRYHNRVLVSQPTLSSIPGQDQQSENQSREILAPRVFRENTHEAPTRQSSPKQRLIGHRTAQATLCIVLHSRLGVGQDPKLTWQGCSKTPAVRLI